MLRDDDEFDDWKYECPHCGRTFGTFGLTLHRTSLERKYLYWGRSLPRTSMPLTLIT
jgi:hypothetical protein